MSAGLGRWAGRLRRREQEDTEFVEQRNRSEDLIRAQQFQQQAFTTQAGKGVWTRYRAVRAPPLQIDSGLGAAWHNAGICFMEEKRYMESRDAFLRAAELLATDPRPYENLGVLHRATRAHTQAYDAYGRALERDPYSLAALRGSASSIRLLGPLCPPRARHASSAALRSTPTPAGTRS